MKNTDTVSICIDGNRNNVEFHDIKVLQLESIVKKVDEFTFQYIIVGVFSGLSNFWIMTGV